jgi:hypothetical protein
VDELKVMNSVQIQSSRIGTDSQAHLPRGMAPVTLDLENKILRQAVQENLVSFPAQVPVFEKRSRPDLQQKIVVLYFVHGWTMDDIAQRYGLGRQRMGQILTAWRIRAVKEGYVQAIEPEHPLLRRVTLDETKQYAEPVVDGAARIPSTPIAVKSWAEPEAEETQPVADVPELRGANLDEELRAIVGVLDNQLRLRSNSMNASIDSCEQLLARAQVLCARLETRSEVAPSNVKRRIAVVISDAKELFRRFQDHAAKRVSNSSNPVFASAGQGRPVRLIPSANNTQNLPPRRSQRIAVSV